VLAVLAFRLLALGVVGAGRAPFEQPFEQPAPEASSQVAAKNAVLDERIRAANDTPGALAVTFRPAGTDQALTRTAVLYLKEHAGLSAALGWARSV
jgi:hypothetical protein